MKRYLTFKSTVTYTTLKKKIIVLLENENKMETNEAIGAFAFKSKTPDGGICKTIVNVLPNGVSNVNQVFLVDEDKPLNPPAIKIYTKCKKSIWVVAFGIKYPSLFMIFKGVSDILEANKIEGKDII